jgi:predicted TIM-barrel fold metal-dependent hydrolase
MEKYRMSLSNPLLLEDVLVRHPKMRIYIMHGGWPFLDEMIGLLYAHPQVYIDVAVINWVLPRKEFHQYLRRIVEAGYEDRIMYGSDQMQWPQSIKISVENILTADFLTRAQKEDILYNNASRFLRFSAEEIRKDKSAVANALP